MHADLAAFVGWYQEKQAGDIVAQLKAGISLRAIVIRDGQEHDIEAREVVPGDIVVVEDGMTIPADGRVRRSFHLFALTAAGARRVRRQGRLARSRHPREGRDQQAQPQGGR